MIMRHLTSRAENRMSDDQASGGQPWPQHGQPYPPQPQYPPPGYPPQPQYPPPGYPPQPQYPPPGYPPPGHRQRKSWPRRHKLLTAILGLFGFVVIGVIANYGGSANHTVTTGQAGGTSSSTPSASKTAGSAARVGSVITLTGNNAGEKVAVTVTRIISHAKPASDFDAPQSGKRLYAVQFRLDDTGYAAYSDSPSNGAVVVDSAGQSYQSSFDNAAGCQSFPGTENIAAGETGLGCIVFEAPVTAKITKVQFTLDSGFGPQTGQWDVSS
jgi:hypothetical protein